MDIAHLSYYSTLCETLNYTEAARKCFISRQAMRQSLIMLEKTFGLTLIENRGNRLFITPAGQVLYDRVRPVLSAYRELNATMQTLVLSDRVLRIGVSRSVTPYYAPEVLNAIDRFAGSYPGIPFEIVLLPTDELADRLESGSLDAGIIVEMREPAAGSADMPASPAPAAAPAAAPDKSLPEASPAPPAAAPDKSLPEASPAPPAAAPRPSATPALAASLPAPGAGSPSGPTPAQSFVSLPEYRRTILRTDTLLILLPSEHPLAGKTSLTLEDLDGQTVMIMGRPERFFGPLYQALAARKINVNWKIVPDYYEVTYRVIGEGWLAVDRSDDSANVYSGGSSNVEETRPLENGRFRLHCTLLTPGRESSAIQLFRQALKLTAPAAPGR